MAENETMVNAEEYGFTDEDLQEVEVIEPVEEEAETESIPSNTESDAEPSTEVDEPAEVEPDEEPHQNKGNVNHALAEERARRKAYQKQVEELRAQLEANKKPVELTPEAIKDIKEFSQKEALKRLGITDTAEDLLYTDPDKYRELISEQARIEYVLSDKMQAVEMQRQQNIDFVNEIKSLPNFSELFELAQEELDSMTRKESNPIDAAFARTGAGNGTAEDFVIIRNFVDRLEKKLNSKAGQGNPLDTVQNIPKANSLGGGVSIEGKLTEEDIIKAVEEGREHELPADIQKQLKELIG